MNYRLVLTTCPSREEAETLAGKILQARLAACVSIIPGLLSLYEWQGTLQREPEVQLLIKTRAEAFSQLEALVQANHSYELPELIAIPIEAGSAPYLNWIDSSLQKCD